MSSMITLDDLWEYFHVANPAIFESTVNWRVYELVKDAVLKRIGRGMFVLG
jgi:hypothetical protein